MGHQSDLFTGTGSGAELMLGLLVGGRSNFRLFLVQESTGPDNSEPDGQWLVERNQKEKLHSLSLW